VRTSQASRLTRGNAPSARPGSTAPREHATAVWGRMGALMQIRVPRKVGFSRRTWCATTRRAPVRRAYGCRDEERGRSPCAWHAGGGVGGASWGASGHRVSGCGSTVRQRADEQIRTVGRQSPSIAIDRHRPPLITIDRHRSGGYRARGASAPGKRTGGPLPRAGSRRPTSRRHIVTCQRSPPRHHATTPPQDSTGRPEQRPRATRPAEAVSRRTAAARPGGAPTRRHGGTGRGGRIARARPPRCLSVGPGNWWRVKSRCLVAGQSRAGPRAWAAVLS
jgi:hypothetical protein